MTNSSLAREDAAVSACGAASLPLRESLLAGESCSQQSKAALNEGWSFYSVSVTDSPFGAGTRVVDYDDQRWR
jgi:hypothetical protein